MRSNDYWVIAAKMFVMQRFLYSFIKAILLLLLLCVDCISIAIVYTYTITQHLHNTYKTIYTYFPCNLFLVIFSAAISIYFFVINRTVGEASEAREVPKTECRLYWYLQRPAAVPADGKTSAAPSCYSGILQTDEPRQEYWIESPVKKIKLNWNIFPKMTNTHQINIYNLSPAPAAASQ